MGHNAGNEDLQWMEDQGRLMIGAIGGLIR